MESTGNCEKYSILSNINSPKDLQDIKDLDKLCEEIRNKIIEVVSKNGGHLSSNLGVVELTVALHKTFSNDNDCVIWDVSHQSYAHKMLTGRFKNIDTIRKEKGISGFTNKKESKYDLFTKGHSSTSISAALGVAESKRIKKESGHVIAVIGDGALTGGLAYEGLNNAGRLKKNFIIVLNDNKMSISKNVGAVARYLATARIRPSYLRAKNALYKILNKTNVGISIKNFMKYSKSVIKKAIYKNNIFEDMGFAYYGPVDGHNLDELQKAFSVAKSLNKPTVVHVITTKGKGYECAEKDPRAYHCVKSFDIATGKKICEFEQKTFSQEFGDAICELAEENPNICAVTAAMTNGTSLDKFKEKFKTRFFDVGIAEEHAVTFCGGLASGGMTPIFAVYSTFLQRAYDEIIHDVALQNVGVVLAVDRAGLVGDDGETHNGIFDVSFLSSVPGIKIFSPSFIEEVKPMLKECVNYRGGVSVIRYPRGCEFKKPDEFKYTGNGFDLYGNLESENLLVTYGRIFSNLWYANERLTTVNKKSCLLKINVIKPINDDMVEKILKFKKVFFFEESVKSGSISEKIGNMLSEKGFNGKYKCFCIEDNFVEHASVKSQLKRFGLDIENMVRKTIFN